MLILLALCVVSPSWLAGPVVGNIIPTSSSRFRGSTETLVSYVIEPFETVADEWFFDRPAASTSLNVSSEEVLFGNHALRLNYTLQQSPTQGNASASNSTLRFGWIQQRTPYNCQGASFLSLWYKIPSDVNLTGGERLRLSLFDDSTCVRAGAATTATTTTNTTPAANVTCDRMQDLDEYVLWDQPLAREERRAPSEERQWREVRVPLWLPGTWRDTYPNRTLNLSRIRGWKVEIVLDYELAEMRTQSLISGEIPPPRPNNITNSTTPETLPGTNTTIPQANATDITNTNNATEVPTLTPTTNSTNSTTNPPEPPRPNNNGTLIISTGAILFDQLSCQGGGELFGAAFRIGDQFTLVDAIQEGTWTETYYESVLSRNLSQSILIDGKLQIDYVVEQVETWGGFLDLHHLAPGAAYYNLSGATHLMLDYHIRQISSIPERAIVRLVLQDNSHCQVNCDTNYHSHERYYSFHSILDDRGDHDTGVDEGNNEGNSTISGGRGQLIIPFEASEEPTTPFWLTGWSGITGNAELDLSNLKGFTLEVVLDSVLQFGSIVSGSVSFENMLAVREILEPATTMSYVIEPFEVVMADTIQSSIRRVNATMSEDHLFGERSLRVEWNLTESLNGTSDLYSFGVMQSRTPFNCYGASKISLWYKVDSSLPRRGEYRLRLTFYDDTTCLQSLSNISCNTATELDAFILLDHVIFPNESSKWQELSVPLWLAKDYWKGEVNKLLMNRIRGWKLDIIASDPITLNEPSGAIFIDHLACHGGGELFGAAFHIGDQFTLADAIQEGTWTETYYESVLSRNLSQSILIDGKLQIDYVVEQVETWGGFLDFGHLAPGAAYYNLSGATHLMLDYHIRQISSIPERAIIRFVLQDNSHCQVNCDTNYHSHERYYSFHSILDDRSDDETGVDEGNNEGNSTISGGRGQLIIPFEASEEPTTPFWLTGWSGITGNAELDLSNLKGFTLEVVLDSVLQFGSLVNGSVEFSNMAASFHGNTSEMDDSMCVLEDDMYFAEHASQFKRIEFRGRDCCSLCANDPECIYALSNGRDCFIGAYLEPQFVLLKSSAVERVTYQSYWMNDVAKRGDFCERCDCIEDSRTIDCRDKNLTIIPKSFDQLWSPRILDLRNNSLLVLLGAGSLVEVSSYLEEVWLPRSIKHIAIDAINDLSPSIHLYFENDDEEINIVNNVIKSKSESFGSVCCGQGERLLSSTIREGLTFCNMTVHSPGIDSSYEPFVDYEDATRYDVLIPRSTFMAEAAESVEKCAEYCTVVSRCTYFTYDNRLPNAEPACHLLTDNGTMAPVVCCNRDHFADENSTIPGFISGRPPRTRHRVDEAKVFFSDGEDKELELNADNGYTTRYWLSLGSNPIRGAVWIEPKLLSSVRNAIVNIRPSRVVLYDSTDRVAVTVRVSNMTYDHQSGTLVIDNVIQSCDEAFASNSASSNVIYVRVTAPTKPQKANLGLSVGLPIAAVVAIGIIFYAVFQINQSKNDSVWKVKRSELLFTDPPEIIGRGTFGLVLLAEYRGTQVAVKRVIPPRSGRKNRESSGMDSSFGSSSHSSSSNKAGVNSNMGSLSFKPSVGMTSWGGMGLQSGSAGKSPIASSSDSRTTSDSQRMTASMGKPQSAGMFKSRSRFESVATYRKLKADFVEEMRQLSKLRHPCITTVMGAVIERNVEPMLVMEYMDHGSLYDLLHNETMFLESELLLPILRDISQGMRFLHSATPQVIHGDLKAQNILVDSKFRAKVADFGLSQKKHVGATGTPLWMAPELLRGESVNTPASDMYSFGIILYEVYSRQDPYLGEDVKEVLRLVADPLVNKRPPFPRGCPGQIQSLMTDCLMGEPNKRPTAEELDTRLKRIEILESPQEKNKSSSMSLFDIFPRHIAEALRDGKPVEAEHRDVVTIFFSDIVGFTTISSSLPPGKVAMLLDRLYKKFDELSHKYDIFKVETIGDAYMAVTNLVKDQPHDHAKRIARFAIDAVKSANEIYIDEDEPEKGFVNIRVGFHSGPVVADVVGTRNPRYCLFGDTVNTASRMESTSAVNRIHCSDRSAEILREQDPELPVKDRGLIPIKGKGEMHTFWVNEQGAEHRQSRIGLMSFDEMSLLNWVAGSSGGEPPTRKSLTAQQSKMELIEESLPHTQKENMNSPINQARMNFLDEEGSDADSKADSLEATSAEFRTLERSLTNRLRKSGANTQVPAEEVGNIAAHSLDFMI